MLLLLEDDPLLRDTLCDFLSEQYKVLAAPNGLVGIMLFERFQSSIRGILTDYEMPEVNGIEFLQYVRQKGYSTPALVMTGKALSQDELEAIVQLTGALPLFKPINFDTIVVEVERRFRYNP